MGKRSASASTSAANWHTSRMPRCSAATCAAGVPGAHVSGWTRGHAGRPTEVRQRRCQPNPPALCTLLVGGHQQQTTLPGWEGSERWRGSAPAAPTGCAQAAPGGCKPGTTPRLPPSCPLQRRRTAGGARGEQKREQRAVWLNRAAAGVQPYCRWASHACKCSAGVAAAATAVAVPAAAATAMVGWGLEMGPAAAAQAAAEAAAAPAPGRQQGA